MSPLRSVALLLFACASSGAVLAAPGAYLGAALPEGGPARVGLVVPGSPAAKAGLRPGDTILEFNGKRLRGAAELCELLGLAYPKQTFELVVERGGEKVRLKASDFGTWSDYYRAHPAPPRSGSAIYLSGYPVEIGTPVVTWRDPAGYDGYAERRHFSEGVLPTKPASGCNLPERYGQRRGLAPELGLVAAQRGLTRDLAALQIDQVVIHYDVAWTSQNCFKVLHDIRGLSCHFLLDVDGTLYQTLDLSDRARHAGGANDRSIGIEIAHPGPLELTANLAARYGKDEQGIRFDLGALAQGVRTPDFVVRPARREPISGEVQGKRYSMYDYTDAQYESLIRLIAGLRRVLPRIRNAYPMDTEGAVVTRVLPADELAKWSGLLGHYHVSGAKQDPGPAFNWIRLTQGVTVAESDF